MSRRSEQLPNLDKLFKDEDDQDFSPIAGSNLSALFGSPKNFSDSSVSLKSTIQKKSSSGRNTPQPSQPANKTEVIVAKVVHGYKLINGQYKLIGKLGLALIGNASTRVYQIILYRTKQEHISTVNVKPEFSYTVRENNYATYYDSNNENWSLLFENEASCVEFAREVGASRYHSIEAKADDSILYQNLSANPETDCAKEGDEVCVKSVIFSNCSQPLKFDDSSTQDLRVKISQYDNWQKNLMDCAKGLKRLLILPPSKQISLGPGYPKERDVMMEIEILEIVKSESKSPPLGKTSSGKASILSRMAKMGQSMLPKIPTSTTDSEDTEEEIHMKSPRRFKPDSLTTHAPKHHQTRTSQESIQDPVPVTNLVSKTVVPTTVPLPHRPVIATHAFPSSWPVTPIQQPYVTMDGQYYPVAQTPIAQPIPIGMDPNINVFLSETRTQNTEIRMGISKIADNVQKILDKFHVLEVQNASGLRRPMQHFVDEMTLNDKSNEGHSERSCRNFLLENRSENEAQFKEREKELEAELNEVRGLLKDRVAKYDELNFEKQKWSKERVELENKIAKLEGNLSESENALEGARAFLRTITSDNNSQKNSAHLKNAEIKKLMNNTYRILLDQFKNEETYTADQIKETLAASIRNITFSVLENSQRDRTKSVGSDVGEDSESTKDNESLSEAVGTSKMNPTIPVAQDEPPPVPPIDDTDW